MEVVRSANETDPFAIESRKHFEPWNIRKSKITNRRRWKKSGPVVLSQNTNGSHRDLGKLHLQRRFGRVHFLDHKRSDWGRSPESVGLDPTKHRTIEQLTFGLASRRPASSLPILVDIFDYKVHHFMFGECIKSLTYSNPNDFHSDGPPVHMFDQSRENDMQSWTLQKMQSCDLKS